MHESRAVARLAVCFPGLRVERPQLAARARVECDDAVERRGEEQRVVNGERCCLEQAGARGFLPLAGADALLVRLPNEGRLEARHVVAVDVSERRVLEAARVVAVVGPINGTRRGLLRGERSAGERGDDEQEAGVMHEGMLYRSERQCKARLSALDGRARRRPVCVGGCQQR